MFNPFPNNKFKTLPKLKGLADDNFKFDESGIKLSKWLENTEGKGEIARYEQFLFFLTVFSKDLSCKHVKTRACLGKGYRKS